MDDEQIRRQPRCYSPITTEMFHAVIPGRGTTSGEPEYMANLEYVRECRRDRFRLLRNYYQLQPESSPFDPGEPLADARDAAAD